MTLLNVSDIAIYKALYARITFKKYTTYTTHSGSVRKVTTSDFISGIEFDKSDSITPVRKTSLAGVTANGHWYWDRDNSLVYFYYSGSNDLYNIIIKISIFVTTGFDILAKSDFEDTTFNDLIVYENRLQETSFSQSIEDILNGRFGIFSGNLSLINNDSRYNFLGNNNITFKNADVSIYIAINDISNNKLIFKGVCESASFNGAILDLAIIEWTKILQLAATFGDDSSWYKTNKTRWSSIRDVDLYKMVPMFLFGSSRNSAFKNKSTYYYIDSGTLENVYIKNYEFWDVDISTDFPTIYCGNVAADGFWPDGKKYIMGRSIGEYPDNYHLATKSDCPVLLDYIADADISLTESIYFGVTYGYRYAEYTITGTANNEIDHINLFYTGMLVYLFDGVAYYDMIITFVDTVNRKFGIRHFGGPSNTSIKNPAKTFKILYKGATVYTIIGETPVYLDGMNYRFIKENTAQNVMMYLIVNAELGTLGYEYYDGSVINTFRLYNDDLSWTADDVPNLQYYVRFLSLRDTIQIDKTSNYDIGQTLNIVTRRCGIDTDSDSDILTSGNSYYQYQQNIGGVIGIWGKQYIDIVSPEIGSEEPEPYIDLIERILFSTASFLCQNALGELIVRTFVKYPYDYATYNLTEDDIIDGSVKSDIIFNEICSSIWAKNQVSKDLTVTSDSTKNRRLFGEARYSFNHQLKSSKHYNNKVKSIVEAYKFNPIKMYNFKVINKGYEMTLGDIINIQLSNSGKWLDSDTSKELFIIKLNKSLSGVEITAVENTFKIL